VNEGNTTAIPQSASALRAGVGLDAQPGGTGTTDSSGLAVIIDLPEGGLNVIFDGGPWLPFTVAASGDVYDLAVAYNGEEVAAYPNFAIRYGVGGDIVRFSSDADAAEVSMALSTRDNIVFFRNGLYRGDLLITGDNVIFFGEGFTERQVVIDGSVEIRGTGVRIRGFTITGDVRVLGNDFGMAFSIVQGRTDVLGNSVALLRNALCGPVTVPSSNATLLDNEGIAPLTNVDPAYCE
jgi:hypothetical protein